MRALEGLVAAETVAVALLALLVVSLLRSHGEILRTLRRLGADVTAGEDQQLLQITPRRPTARVSTAATGAAPAPPVTGTTPSGDAVALAMQSGRDTLLAFLSTGCETCVPFWQALADGQAVPGGADVVIVTRDPENESASLLRRLAPATVPVVQSSQAWADYDVPGSPHFAYVDGSSGAVVGEGTAQSWPQVLDLIGRAAADEQAHPAGLDQDDPQSVDAALAHAGIAAGDPRLYADPNPDPDAAP